MGNVIVWASIPVTDLPRAIAFYKHVTGNEVMSFPGMEDKVASILGPGPQGERIVSADLSVGGTPSVEGSVPYLAANGDIKGMVARVTEAGGTVLQEPQFMGDMIGWIAFFVDSEGNRIGIQQPG